jgi:ornithine cyclodeaminase
MRIVSAAEVAAATPYPALIAALRDAFAGLATVTAPPRGHHQMAVAGRAERTLLTMPAWGPDGAVMTKLVTVAPDNGARGLPAVQAAVLLSDAETAEWRWLIDGPTLTARRTAAASALAATFLARADAATLLVVGAGRLAPELIAAHAAVRPIRRVLIWARRGEQAAQAAAAARDAGFDAAAAPDLGDACAQADVISCATLSTTPLVLGAWLRPGRHLDLVGAFRRTMRETDAEAVRLAQVFVDTRAGAEGEAGDLHHAAAERAFSFFDIRADLAELCGGAHPGRRSNDEITLFKSVGASIEDHAAARLVARSLSA